VKSALVELIRRAKDYSQDEATTAFDRYESFLARSLASISPSLPPESAKAVSRATFSSEHRSTPLFEYLIVLVRVFAVSLLLVSLYRERMDISTHKNRADMPMCRDLVAFPYLGGSSTNNRLQVQQR
jgi:hypothetical protein